MEDWEIELELNPEVFQATVKTLDSALDEVNGQVLALLVLKFLLY